MDTVVIGNNTYAVVASERDDGIEIIDITDPTSPNPVGRITDNSTLALDGASGVDTVVIGNNTYAVVGSQIDDGIEIIDITDPTSPNPVGRITDNSTLALDGALGVDTVVIGNNTYAIVASQPDNGIEIIDITTPASPSSVARVIDNSTLALAGAITVDIVVIGTNTYAVVASISDNGVQIIDLGTAVPPLTGSSSTTGNVSIQSTCGIGLSSGAPISYGALAPNTISTEQTLVIQNTGNINATTFVSGTSWLDSSNNTIITIDNTKYSSSTGDYSTKTSLTTDDASLMVIQPNVNTDTFWQLQATLADTSFSGNLTQTVNFAATC